MPSIKFACSCGKAYKVPDKFAGKRVKCKQCDETIRVPSQSEGGVSSMRASAVTSQRLLTSKRLEPASGSGRSSSSGRASSSGKSSSGKSSSPEAEPEDDGEGGGGGGAAAALARAPKKAKEGATTDKFTAVDLGNSIKLFQKKKEEQFNRGEGRLTYFEEGKPKKAFKLARAEVLIGRGEKCGVQLQVASVSREHVKIEFKLGTYIATDQQSSNGLVVNGRNVRRTSLRDGDVLQLGEAILRIDC